MKVVFLFMSKGSAAPGTSNNDWLTQKCGPQYQETFGDECYFQMLQTLFDEGTITDLKVFFESGVNPGRADFVKGAYCYVVPEISMIEPFIDYDTIIFARGGFKHWHDFLYSYKHKNWLVIYAANTGRHKWTWWDVNLDDTNMANIVDLHGRYQFPFIKPTNETIFKPDLTADKIKYDICIGASHIHDKKGQYHVVKLMNVFREMFGYFPTAIMPGSLRRSTHTVEMLGDQTLNDEVICPGMVSKPELKEIYSKCKVFLHFGSCGQNDRSVLEAYACGMPLGIRTLSTHNPLLKPDESTIYHFDIDNDPDYQKSANKLKLILDFWDISKKEVTFAKYKRLMGYDQVAIPSLRRLFSIMAFVGKPSIDAKEHIRTQMDIFGKEQNGKY